MANIKQIMDFLFISGKLKETYRYSEHPILKDKESSADHSWRLALMAFVVADELKIEIDVEKTIKIALVHDIAEAITGDIDALRIFRGEISEEEKQKEEADAIEKLKDTLGEDSGKEIKELWLDYEYGKSKEARYIKALDKMEALIYMIEKETIDEPDLMASYADKAVEDSPELKPFLKEIKTMLKVEFVKAEIPWKKEYTRYS